MKLKKLNKKQKEILEKAREIISDRNDAKNYMDECIIAMICPKCGDKIEYSSSEIFATQSFFKKIITYKCLNPRCKFKLSEDKIL